MELYGSLLNISGSVTASSFTGSFIGDGSGLTGIQASGVTGLNLSQISNGDATASISSKLASIKIEFSVRLFVYSNLSILYICSLAFQITYKVFHFRLPIIDIFLHTLVSLFGFGL
jgi:hypothetical protein